MTRGPLPRLVRCLLGGCLAALSAISLADLLMGLVQRYAAGPLEAAARANRYWPLSWQYDYVHWLYSTYFLEALFIGLVGGLLAYWNVSTAFGSGPPGRTPEAR
jgi:hypothetical protein